jgi:glycolate oxidase FAD binding subunit
MGGKVVKNAAGFDLPKFFVGSAGRFGVLAELTFKVFPRAAAEKTLRLEPADTAEQGRMLRALGRGRWEVDALDAPLAENAVYVRLAGPAAALEMLAQEILSRWPGKAMEETAAAAFWRSARELDWAHAGGALAKVALTPAQVPEWIARVRGDAAARGWVSAGGNVGYVSAPAGALLPKLDWPAVTLRGDAALWPGAARRFEIMRAVKAALDPQKRFPDLDE